MPAKMNASETPIVFYFSIITTSYYNQ